MTRVYSAISNEEDLILDQLENDILLASEMGGLDTEQYSISFSDDGLVIYDKVNSESTAVHDNKGVIELRDLPDGGKKVSVGSKVSWTDAAGDHHKGTLTKYKSGNGYVETSTGTTEVVSKDLIKSDMNRSYSKSRQRHYLIDSGGNVMAFGHTSSLGKLREEHPDWMEKSQYDLNRYLNKLNKSFSNFSEENQRLFTRSYRRYAVLDENGRLKHIVDVTNAHGLVAKNPGWSMVREAEYRKSHQVLPNLD